MRGTSKHYRKKRALALSLNDRYKKSDDCIKIIGNTLDFICKKMGVKAKVGVTQPSMPKTLNPNRSLEIFSCKKSDYSRRCHHYSICILTQYVSFIQFRDKMKAKFSNDRFGIKKRVEGISSENQMRFRKIIVFLRKQNKIYGTIQIRFFQKGAQQSDHECCHTLQSRM